MCQQNQSALPPASMQPWSWLTWPWSRLHVDQCSSDQCPFQMDRGFSIEHCYCLDNDSTIEKTVCSLWNSWHNCASEFQEFDIWMEYAIWEWHPSPNGLAERAVKNMKEGMKNHLQSGHTLTDQITRMLFQYRITPPTTTAITPAELLLGRKPKSRFDILSPQVVKKSSQQKSSHNKC